MRPPSCLSRWISRTSTPGPQTCVLTGRIVYEAPDWVYIPLRVPAGVSRITVSYSYDKPAPPPGYDGTSDATPGYLPGPVRPAPGMSSWARTRWRGRA